MRPVIVDYSTWLRFGLQFDGHPYHSPHISLWLISFVIIQHLTVTFPDVHLSHHHSIDRTNYQIQRISVKLISSQRLWHIQLGSS